MAPSAHMGEGVGAASICRHRASFLDSLLCRLFSFLCRASSRLIGMLVSRCYIEPQNRLPGADLEPSLTGQSSWNTSQEMALVKQLREG